MKRILVGLFGVLMIMLLTVSVSFGDEYVNGYMRQDGKYVEGYYKSSPNQNRYDNYSAQGNYNPYTGNKGTQRHEFSNPPAYNQPYGTSYEQNQNYNNYNKRNVIGTRY